MSNTNCISSMAQNNSENTIQMLKSLGIEFYIDQNGVPQSRRSKIIDPEKLITDPELIKHYKGGWFISDPTETNWIYIRIVNGRIKEVIPVTSMHINSVSIINYNNGYFDFILVEYSTNTEHTDPKNKIITHKNYSPKRITNDLTGTPYISEAGEKIKGAFLYHLVSGYVRTSTSRKILYIGKNQGWWITPENKYRFNPGQNFRNKILENLPSAVQRRENPIQSTSQSQDITEELQRLFEDKLPFQVSILFRMGSMFSTFFTHFGVISDQLLVVHPNKNISIQLACALFKNTRYDNLNAAPLGPNIKPLKYDLQYTNDGVVISIDSFSADQYSKIEKGIDCLLNDINGATEENTSVNRIPVIISSFADLHIPQNMRCVLEFDDFKTEYDAIRYKNLLRKLDASLVLKAENDFENFIKTFFQHLKDVKNRIPSNMPKSKVNTFIRLLTMIRTYNALFSPFFPVSLEKTIEEWLCTQEQDTKSINDIICAEFSKILNNKIDNGYFKLVMKEDVTPFDKDNHTLIVDKLERRIYIETAESFSIVRNEMESISDTDSLTTALNSEGYLHTNVHNSKCHRLHIIDSKGNIHSLYSHGIKFNLISPQNKQRFDLIDKEMNLFKYDEIPSENFLPLIKTIDGRFAGKMLVYEAEESNHYFGSGRTGSGKSWALSQLIPMLFMLGHTVVVFDVSGTYTREKLYKMLPREVVDILFHFINVGVKNGQDKIPVNLGSLKSCNSLPDKKKTIFSVIRAATGHLDKGAERVLIQMLSAYLIDKNETVDLNDLCSSFNFNGLTGNNTAEMVDSVLDDINETEDFNNFCPSFNFNGSTGSNIADLVGSVLDDINEIGFEDRTWDELFEKYNRTIVINLGNEVGDSTHQLLDMLVASLFNWQMFHDSKFLSIFIDELKDQDFTKGAPLNTIIGQGRKFHTALLGATQDYFNQGSSYLDVMKQSNTKSFGRPGKSGDRIAQVLGYRNAIDAGFNTAKAGDVIIESDYYNKELGINEAATIKGRVVDFIDTPFYEKFKERFGNRHE